MVAILALTIALIAPPAFAAPPSTIGPDGASVWSYADLYDASAKYEGGYATFDDTSTQTYTESPHGGYDTTTNKCKVCHAVHRAEGAYYLLRADSQDDACDYCHIGGSAHSSTVVYDANPAGKYTTNGHTIGASSSVPDSTVAQWTETITLRTADANGDPLSEDIQVRAYSDEKQEMYRFTVHHGHRPVDNAGRGYLPVGPLALRCMSCHQVHNAPAQTWQTVAMSAMNDAGGYTGTAVSGYKLLRQFPSGSFTARDASGEVAPADISLVPETDLLPGVTFDAVRAQGEDPGPLALVRDGVSLEFNRPLWVAQAFDHPGYGSPERSNPVTVNSAALSVWCADCHNLNIGGSETLANPELGFKAHTERTHPVPYVGAFSGPGQCYSCHRSDLPRINTGDPCSQCHYGTGNYRENRYDAAGAEYVASDFPHSGEAADYKLLGSYSVDVAGLNPTTIDDSVTVGADNLDAVCLRCHWVEEKYHASDSGGGSGDGHAIPAEYAECTTCHLGEDVTVLHAATPAGCGSCHDAGTLTTDCATCHPERLEPHGFDATTHLASPPVRWMLVIDQHDSAMDGSGAIQADCTTCHATDLAAVHDNRCATCHPTPRNSFAAWNGDCQQGGCHVTFHDNVSAEHAYAVDQNMCSSCHGSGWAVTQASCWNCHSQYYASDTSAPTTTADVRTSYTGMARIDLAMTDNGGVGVGTTYYSLDGGPTRVGSEVVVTAAGDHVLEAWSVDQSGNVETPHKTFSFTILPDTIAPVTTSNAVSEYWSQPAYVRLTGTDNGTYGVKTTYYRVDGGAVQTGTTAYVPEPANATETHTLEFWSEDWSGNVEAPNSVTFTMTGGTATFRLTTGPMIAGEYVVWHIHPDSRSSREVFTARYDGPFAGKTEDVQVDVRPGPYYVWVGWGDNTEPYDEAYLGYFDMSVPGTVVSLP